MDQRTEGRSGYTLRKLVGHAVDIAFECSVRPLPLVTALGFLVGPVGLALFITALWLYFSGTTTPASRRSPAWWPCSAPPG
jgi:hypothetical protein